MNKVSIIATLHIALASIAPFAVSSCSYAIEETVETAYTLPIPTEPQYSFSRHGYSSVDYSECDYLSSPINYVYTSYLKSAKISNTYNYNTARKYLDNGEYGLSPMSQIAHSPLHGRNRERIISDIEELFSMSAQLSGYGAAIPREWRARQAGPGVGGAVGLSVYDSNVFFVDSLGLCVADAWILMMQGSIYLDKILNLHLSDTVMHSIVLRNLHERVVLLPGANYTELEHHWDLAYGYYLLIRSYARAEGLTALKEVDRSIYLAFVEGRRSLETFDYTNMLRQISIIRGELSRVFAVRAIYKLQGKNTLANINEKLEYGFSFMATGYGFIYDLQFTLRPDGTPYFTYSEVTNILSTLLSGNGLWERQRLTADENTEGSVANISKRIAERYELSVSSIIN